MVLHAQGLQDDEYSDDEDALLQDDKPYTNAYKDLLQGCVDIGILLNQLHLQV